MSPSRVRGVWAAGFALACVGLAGCGGQSGTTVTTTVKRDGGADRSEATADARPAGGNAAPAMSKMAAGRMKAEGKGAARPMGGMAPPQVQPQAPYRGGYDGLQAEQYRHFADNGYKLVGSDPVSTFSADVSTAGYSNVRRFLAEGKLPPADAVRIAELLNYFPYSYPAPTDAAPVAFALAAAPCPWQPQHHLVRVGLKAKQIDPAHLPPRNLTFLIDTSGSMYQPTRLPLVKKSLHLLIDQLTSQDVVTIVTYAGSAGLKLPPTRGDQKARIRSVVDGLDAGGSTDGAGGIALAYEHARMNYLDGGANRVILCTDGDFNVGITSEGELVRLIEKQREGNVFLTVLGYGMGNLKDATLEKLANHGNGHYAYIDSEAEAHKVFVEQGGALVAVAKDVKLQVEFNPAVVQAYRLIGYENRLLKTEDFKDDTKDAGDLGSGHTVTALYEVVPVGVPLNAPGVDPLKYQKPTNLTPAARSGEWLTAKMRYKHPESAKSLEVAAVLTGDALDHPMSGDFRFAAAVAEFGLLLRDSPFKGTASYDRVLSAADSAKGADPGGHRAEFTGIVRQARRLVGVTREEAVGSR